jgi:rhomboid protease GluP
MSEIPEAPPPPDPQAEFVERLRALTPRVFVTWILVAINSGLFVAQLATGVDIMNPEVEQLIRWGANYGPLTTGGQPWRLFTSMFLHIGALHIAMNMIVLAQSGPLLERLFGQAGFIAIYLVAGLGGSLVSVAVNPAVCSAGASGAIFGLYGALFAFLLQNSGIVPRPILQRLIQAGAFFVVINVGYGLSKSGIDQGAHFGGLAFGFLAGLVLGKLPDARTVGGRTRRALLVGIVGTLLTGGVALAMPRAYDPMSDFKRLDAVEKTTLPRFNDLVQQTKTGALSDEKFAEALDKEVLGPWEEIAKQLESANLRRQPQAMQKLHGNVKRYVIARRDAFRLFRDGAKKHDPTLVDEGNERMKEAERITGELAPSDKTRER